MLLSRRRKKIYATAYMLPVLYLDQSQVAIFTQPVLHQDEIYAPAFMLRARHRREDYAIASIRQVIMNLTIPVVDLSPDYRIQRVIDPQCD